jgi:zinc/manganese transport system permease protein
MATDAIDLLALPLAASLLLVAIHTALGIQVLARGVIFVDLALAQVAALGATVAFMLGHPVAGPATFGYSLAFTLAAALVLAGSRGWSARIPQEALIGVLYVVAAAAAFLLVDKAPQGAEHIRQILTGNILTVGAGEVLALLPLYAAVGALHWLARRPLAAQFDGWRRWAWDLVFYASFGVVVTSSVALAGVLLVFAFLIIPAAIGVLLADRTALQLAIGWAAGAVASAFGLALSYAADLPTGATMVCVFGAGLVLAGAVKRLRGHGGPAAALAGLRATLGVALAASGLWLMVAPRADQPLLDAIEAATPGLRRTYMSRAEIAAHADAAEHAERYAGEAERLNEREARSRFEGRAIDDAELRRIASFLKSYGEMQKGERFVMREIRSRARERARWWAGPLAIAVGIGLWPGIWRRWRSARDRRRSAV